jgi:hypothetical protein
MLTEEVRALRAEVAALSEGVGAGSGVRSPALAGCHCAHPCRLGVPPGLQGSGEGATARS